MRNRLIHGYDQIDLHIMWDTIEDDLPPLITELEKLSKSVKQFRKAAWQSEDNHALMADSIDFRIKSM